MMDSFVDYYPQFYDKATLQTFVVAGLISQKVVDARIKAVDGDKAKA